MGNQYYFINRLILYGINLSKYINQDKRDANMIHGTPFMMIIIFLSYSYYPNYFCSFHISLHTFGAVQKVVNSNMDTGTAVTTMKDCNALILSSPIVNNKTATAPINNAQNTRKSLDGLPLPVIAIEIVKDIESVVVRTKIIVATINKNPIIVPNGNCSVMAIIAAGGPLLFNASETEHGFINS